MESPTAFLARFIGDIGLPRYYGGSASTLAVSRPARRSLALQPAWTTDPLKGPFLEVLQVIRRLLTRPECFRLEREFAGPDFHRGGKVHLYQGTHNNAAERALRAVALGGKTIYSLGQTRWRQRRGNLLA